MTTEGHDGGLPLDGGFPPASSIIRYDASANRNTTEVGNWEWGKLLRLVAALDPSVNKGGVYTLDWAGERLVLAGDA
jgi:hypothetical protein